MTDATTPSPSSASWQDTLKGIFTFGAGAFIDSQFPHAGVNNPTPNTAGGVAGTAQGTIKAGVPAAWWLIGGLGLVALVILLRRA